MAWRPWGRRSSEVIAPLDLKTDAPSCYDVGCASCRGACRASRLARVRAAELSFIGVVFAVFVRRRFDPDSTTSQCLSEQDLDLGVDAAQVG
jgi:hypothetical protein